MDINTEATTLAVHRCRFIDYAPSAITALAYPPLPLPSVKGKKKSTAGKQPLRFGILAAGHANGNIDIREWVGDEQDTQCSQAWVVSKTLPGPYPSKVDSLVFILRHPDDLGPDDVPKQSQLRLFSSGGGSELVEWDLERGCIRRTISSQGGSIWSVAANPSCTSLALGCEDGTVRILSVANDTLTHSRRFDRVKCRMLSIAWGPPVPRQPGQKQTSTTAADSDSSDDEDEDEWTDSWLVTGGSDSSLRKWDVATGRTVDRMGVDKQRGERTLVWAVAVLGDGTIISGDSLGIVKFWDSRTCTQLYSFQAHSADVLCMAVSPDGKALYTSGVDQKTVQFSVVKTSNTTDTASPSSRWTQTTSKRMHSHDVRTLSIWPPYTPLPPSYRRQFPLSIAPILASGGLDMSIVLTPVAPPTSTIVKVTNPLETSQEATFEDSYHRKLSYVAQGAVKVARGARLVSCVREAGLTVWRIHRKPDEKEMPSPEDIDLDALDDEPFAGGWEKVLEMEFNVNSNIIAHEISDDGSWLVVSDLYESKLFSLRTDDKGQVNVKRTKDFASILKSQIPASSAHPHSTGSSAFQFTPDSSKLVLTTTLSSYVLVVELTGDKPRVLRRFDHHRIQNSVVHNRVVKGHAGRGANGHLPLANGDIEMSDVQEDEEASPKTAPNGIDKIEDGEASEMDEDNSDSDTDSAPKSPTSIVSISKIAISTDGQWLATSDNHGRTHIFNLDSISHHTVLPSFTRPAQCLAFDPMHPSVLLIVFPNNTIQVYDVETRQFPAWGKALAASLPRKFTENHEVVLGVTFDPFLPLSSSSSVSSTSSDEGKTRYVLFWGSTWMFKAGLDTTIRTGGRKRRRGGEVAPGVAGPEEEKQWRDFKMITHYRPILCCDFLTKEELVIVERPLVDVLLTLPPAYFKHKYGAS